MSTPLLIILIGLLLVLTAFWAIARTRRIRSAAANREAEALARVRAGGSPVGAEGDTVFEAAGLPSHMPARRGIEVSEHDEVVDIEALLAGEPQGVAHRARATLEEPTNISMGLDTLPPRPPTPAPAPVAAAPALSARPQPATPAAVGPAAASPPVLPTTAPARPTARVVPPSPPTLVARLPEAAERMAAAPSPAAAAAKRAPAAAAAPPASGGATIRGGSDDVPLRELALAWFEARGYRSSPASAAVRPIEQVLRHRHDPARAYAFVEENARLTVDRVQQLRTQARSIGLLRVLIVANGGAEDGAATKSRGVRVMDRAALAAEFDQLDFSVAAKIIAVARKRSGVPITLH